MSKRFVPTLVVVSKGVVAIGMERRHSLECGERYEKRRVRWRVSAQYSICVRMEGIEVGNTSDAAERQQERPQQTQQGRNGAETGDSAAHGAGEKSQSKQEATGSV